MKNQSIYITNPREVEIRDAEMPIVREGEALLELLYGGICGSDLGSYRGTYAYAKYPNIPGYEFSARILEIGENDRGLKPGSIVTGNPYFNCGHCYTCRRGLLNCCNTNETMGCHREGAFSKYIAFPVERIYDGKGLDANRLALVEPFCISYHATKRAQVKAGDNVLVIGAGTIGINAMLAAKEKGARVIMADVAQQKLDYAKKLGADGVILNQSHDGFMRAAKAATEGNYFDVTMEAVGRPDTFQACIDAACHGGRVCLIGISTKNLDFNFTALQKKELNVMGSRNALKEDFLEIIDLFSVGKVDPLQIVTNEYDFADAARLFEEFDKNADKMLKVVLKF